ncbi:transmembrane protein 126A-like isoform X1 [Lethenteron reissneri]|uniref:transmembrane protein 126A-like isoform X1 n=2 Tax=Lethenteron reissneri TaxID=7753 RepID=UPI002AB7B030|nr:transmembrane protein 126A-like isoform X1 [Lethenteron reissneri]
MFLVSFPTREELKDDMGWDNELENDLEQPRISPVMGRELRARLLDQIEKLSSSDRKIFNNAAPLMGVGAALGGLVSNSMLRTLMQVREAALASALPSAFIPFLTVTMIHQVVLTESLLGGRLNCELCATTRGTLIGAIGSGVHPFAMALLLNGMLIARYRPWDAPTPGEALRHMLKLSKPVMQRLTPFMMAQAAFGAYLGSKQFSIYTKLRSLPPSEDLPA